MNDERLLAYVDERNAQLTTDAALQAGMGLGFCVLTFGGFWWVAWLLFGSFRHGFSSPLPLTVTAIYAAVATWSAWRGVNPYDNLRPLTNAEVQRREIEEAVRLCIASAGLGSGGAGLGLARREGIAGCAHVLLAGPEGVIKGLRTWRKRLVPDPTLLLAAQGLLDAAAHEPQTLDANPRAAILLAHLGLVRFEADPTDGAVRLHPTAKGKRLAQPAG